MHTLNPDYIVGLVDGEGSFTVYVRDPGLPNETSRRVKVEPKFYVKLVEKDKEILDRLKAFFGCGSVYFQKDTRSNHQNCYRYEVYNRNDLMEKIIPFFKENRLRFPSKRKDFEIFCEMVDIISKGGHLTDQGMRELYRLKQLMH